ncbi:VCBS repeat-containing protein [Flagellimonas flava]|uniref:Repeat domain-containing protein n=1 Tax=Flagellimonas flava TaxID=570519 RepID=A0A1M5HYZ5_9FLAO|nr:VCBS repeat-containing protein [Allomuricauda flava]SHG21092.1 Repeat domain-containing protein [Allomuricauda flava]
MKRFRLRLFLAGILVATFLSCLDPGTDTMFSQMPAQKTGISFVNKLLETEEFNVLEYSYLYNGGGVAIGDINNDGLLDIYFTGNMVGSHLYLNQGNFEFKEIAKEAGVFAEGLWNTGTTMADVNADGLLDIYVCRSAAKAPHKRRNLLFINNGDLTFTEKAEQFGVDDSGYTTHASFFDYDNDGDLDLYVLNHSTQEYAGFDRITHTLKKRKNAAYSDKLYKNEGGYFLDMGSQAGLISNVLGFGLGLSVSDVNNDGWLDIYISNDYNEQDYLYINNQDGTFTEDLENHVGHTSLFSMGSDVADLNNDGYTDIITLDMLPEDNYRQKMVSGPDNYEKHSLLAETGFYHQTMRNMVQLNNQGNSFSEIGQFSGISNTDWSWAALAADYDNDGFKDVYITNGYKRDYTNMDFINYAVQEKLNEDKTGQRTAISELLENMPSAVVENYMYHNNGDLTFNKVNSEWGLDQKSLSNGAAYADLDNDGDLDLVINNIDEPAFIYRNNSETHLGHNFLKVKLQGSKWNTFGIGAKISVNSGENIMVQEMIPSRGYQSSMPYDLVFGLGKDSVAEKLTVRWPDGKVQELHDIEANTVQTLSYADAVTILESEISEKSTHFVSVAADSLMRYRHQENEYNDFKRERLLPHQLSTQGPKIAQGDFDGDGLSDIYIGGAKGSQGGLFRQDRKGGFTAINTSFMEEDGGSEDIDAEFFDADGDGDLDLYVVSGGNAFDKGSEALQDRLYINDGKGNFRKSPNALPKMYNSGSCVSIGDFDADGDQDLFVGGRVLPGEYPESPRSFILINDGKGQFSDGTENVNPDLKFPGMVTDAIWSDINSDGNLDLIVVGEWMPIRVFSNSGNKLEEITQTCGNKDSEGFWNSIIGEDFDNDGDMDFVVGNFGLNSQLKASLSEPATLYVKDFDGNGSLDPVLCSYIMGEEYPAFSKDDLVEQLNGLKSKYVNYKDYANERITDIFTSEELDGATTLVAKNLSTGYLENLGNDQFQFKALPTETQTAPVYGLLSGDFNHDGKKDILLGGNFFGTRVKYGRYDANKGTLLLGDGTGDFEPVNVASSGLNIDGEVRDITNIKLSDGSNLVVFVKNNTDVECFKY